MAVCPKCQGEMGQMEAVCPHCGYDFPSLAKPRSAPWWVYLGLFAVWGAVLIVFQNNPVVQLISGLVALAGLVSLFFGAWRFLRGD